MAGKGKPSPTKWGKRAWQRLSAALKPHRRALVLTHDYPDPDALAAGWAMTELLRTRLKRPARLVYAGHLDRPENREMVKVLRIPAAELSALDFSRRPAVVLVDASPGGGNNPLGAADRVTAVLDNHYGASTAGLGSRLRRHCGATSTMAVELLTAARLRPGTRLATALYYGIKTDTQALGREAAPADETAYRQLFPTVDHRALAGIENPRLPHYTYRMLNAALDGSRRYGKVLVSAMGRLQGREGPASAVDLLVRLEGVDCALAHGYWEGRQIFSVRSLRRGCEAWKLAVRAAGPDGSAGGHRLAAGGSLPAGSAKAAKRAGHLLERRFLTAARAGKKRGRSLV
ncbi:MAG: DHH family phosphoesterase [Planctomycetota bacterium]